MIRPVLETAFQVALWIACGVLWIYAIYRAVGLPGEIRRVRRDRAHYRERARIANERRAEILRRRDAERGAR